MSSTFFCHESMWALHRDANGHESHCSPLWQTGLAGSFPVATGWTYGAEQYVSPDRRDNNLRVDFMVRRYEQSARMNQIMLIHEGKREGTPEHKLQTQLQTYATSVHENYHRLAFFGLSTIGTTFRTWSAKKGNLQPLMDKYLEISSPEGGVAWEDFVRMVSNAEPLGTAPTVPSHVPNIEVRGYGDAYAGPSTWPTTYGDEESGDEDMVVKIYANNEVKVESKNNKRIKCRRKGDKATFRIPPNDWKEVDYEGKKIFISVVTHEGESITLWYKKS